MKSCPRCNRIYSEEDLNFCLDDGEVLHYYADEQPTRPLKSSDPPPTVMMDPPPVTNPIGWHGGEIHPEHQDDNRAQRPVGLIVRIEVLKINAKGPCQQCP